jgi:hypothetical protein
LYRRSHDSFALPLTAIVRFSPMIIYRGLEQAYRFGEKPVTPEIVEAVMAPDMEALEPTLARQGYNAKALAELLNVRHAEIRAFLHSQLPPGRAEELKQQLLGSGIPL